MRSSVAYALLATLAWIALGTAGCFGDSRSSLAEAAWSDYEVDVASEVASSKPPPPSKPWSLPEIPTEPVEDAPMPSEFRKASWVHWMIHGSGACSVDWDGDGTRDNGLMEAQEAFGQWIGGPDPADLLVQTIANGANTLLLQVDFDGGPEPRLHVYSGVDTDDDATNNTGGDAPFVVDARRFSTSMPATVGEAGWSAGPGAVELTLLTVAPQTPVLLRHVQIEVNGVAGPDMSISGGRLVGLLPVSAHWDALNDWVASTCGCLGLGDEPLVAVNAFGKWKCSGVTSTCGFQEALCDLVGSLCPQLGAFVKPDIDIDGDGIKDSMSVGLCFGAVPVEVVGTLGTSPSRSPVALDSAVE